MALTVMVRSGDASSPLQISFDAPRIVIGRGDGCEIRLPDRSVSHRHASIRQRGRDYLILDEGSANGTFVGPVRLSPQAPRVLRSGDLIRVGRVWLEIRIEPGTPTANAQLATKELALQLVADALAAQGEAASLRVRVAAGNDKGYYLLVRQFDKSYSVGRGPDVDLPLTDADVSRRHVEIFRRGDQVYVRDLGSKNGTRLAALSLTSGKEQVWPAASVLEIGSTQLVYEDPVREALLELERSVDEQLPHDQTVDPPRAWNSSEAMQEPVGSPRASAGQRAGSDAPKAALPTRSPPSRKHNARLTDFFVAALALLVLTVSVLGLFWLFRSD